MTEGVDPRPPNWSNVVSRKRSAAKHRKENPDEAHIFVVSTGTPDEYIDSKRSELLGTRSDPTMFQWPAGI